MVAYNDNPYKEVFKDCKTPKELKKKYRELAQKYHPDVNKADPNAEDIFRQINEAYDYYDKLFDKKSNYGVEETEQNVNHGAKENDNKEAYKQKIRELKNLTEEEKDNFIYQIDKATNEMQIDVILFNAKQAEQINNYKISAKERIKGFKNLAEEEKNNFIRQIDEATNETLIRTTLRIAQRQAETNKIKELFQDERNKIGNTSQMNAVTLEIKKEIAQKHLSLLDGTEYYQAQIKCCDNIDDIDKIVNAAIMDKKIEKLLDEYMPYIAEEDQKYVYKFINLCNTEDDLTIWENFLKIYKLELSGISSVNGRIDKINQLFVEIEKDTPILRIIKDYCNHLNGLLIKNKNEEDLSQGGHHI